MIHPTWESDKARLYCGDAASVLACLPAASVNCCVTSPPYFGLRDYGHAGQIGLEPTPDEYVAKLVDVFRAVRRVLRNDGTLWVNLGDSYVANGRYDAKYEAANPGRVAINGGARELAKVGQVSRKGIRGDGIKSKDLLGIPWRVAFALQADGWYLRSDIIWHKPNPMPESVRDRPTKAHEYLFLLSKGPTYYYDAEAVAEVAQEAGKVKYFSNPKKAARAVMTGGRRTGNEREGSPPVLVGATRNRRSVWTVATRPYKGAHFATFPPKLIEPCILAGCPEGGVVLDPFAGSGTTLAVAAEHGRQGIGIELNPAYVALASDRIIAATREALLA